MQRALKITLAAGALAVAGNWASAAEMGAVNEPIKLAINEWTGQHITTQITGKILEAAGYKVEYVVAGYQNMWQAMSEGQLDAAMEVWASNVTDQYRQMHADGKIEDLGELGLEAREGFVYTPPTAELCPGLPDWRALEKCSSIFITAESMPLGRAVDYPAEYGTPGTDRIKALGLPFKPIPAGSEGAVVAEIKASVERKTPLLAFFWRPHWAFAKYHLEFVDLPKGTPECYSDPAYGPNPDVTGDCDLLPSAIFKTAWPGFKDKWPAAYEILKGLTLSVDQQEPMIEAIDVDGQSLDSVTSKWVADNNAAWRPLVDKATE